MTTYNRLITRLKVMQANIGFLMRRIELWSLFVPLALTIALWLLISAGVLRLEKGPLEITAVVVSGLFMIVAAIRFVFNRHVFFLWCAVMLLVIMCREIHFRGTSEAVYICLLGLLGIAVLKYERFERYLSDPLLINLLVAGFFTYFISQTIDQRWWKFVPAEKIVHVSLEEALELVGHCYIGSTSLFRKKI